MTTTTWTISYEAIVAAADHSDDAAIAASQARADAFAANLKTAQDAEYAANLAKIAACEAAYADDDF